MLSLALVGGVIGTFLAIPILELVGSSRPAPAGFLTAAQLALGGGIGWYAGAVVGWALRRQAPPSTPGEARGLVLAAALIIAFGTLVAWWAPSIADWVSLRDDLTGTRFEHMRNVMMLDTYLAAGTCLVLVPARFRRFALVVGAGAGIAILVAATMQFVAARS